MTNNQSTMPKLLWNNLRKGFQTPTGHRKHNAHTHKYHMIILYSRPILDYSVLCPMCDFFEATHTDTGKYWIRFRFLDKNGIWVLESWFFHGYFFWSHDHWIVTGLDWSDWTDWTGHSGSVWNIGIWTLQLGFRQLFFQGSVVGPRTIAQCTVTQCSQSQSS